MNFGFGDALTLPQTLLRDEARSVPSDARRRYAALRLLDDQRGAPAQDSTLWKHPVCHAKWQHPHHRLGHYGGAGVGIGVGVGVTVVLGLRLDR